MSRKERGTKNIELHAFWRIWLSEDKFSLGLDAGREIGQCNFLLFQRNVGLAVKDGSQAVAAKGIAGNVGACF